MPEICDPTTQNGSHYIEWIHTLFGSCVYGNREAASLLLGYASMACWLNAQFPQIIKNYKNKSADGLSIQFLLIWLFGDITNLIGCILTKQLPFQTYLATYFCTVDCALFLQYFYYTWLSPPLIDGDDDDDDDECEEPKELRPMSGTSSIRSNNNSSSSNSNSNNALKNSINDDSKKNYHTFLPSKKKEVISVTTLFALLLLTFNPMSTSSTYSPISTSLPSLTSSSYIIKTHNYSPLPVQASYPNHEKMLTPLLSSSSSLISSSLLENGYLIIGRMMAWICTTLYLTSRVPQIWKNHQRKSVEGLSIIMFIFAALGNLTYTASIFTVPAASSDPSFLVDKIPYIMGSVGTLSFDLTIFLQWCVWKDRVCHNYNHQHPYRRIRSASTHSHSMRLSKRLPSSTHRLGYNTLPSNYYESKFKKQLRDSNNNNMIGSSSGDTRRSVILTDGELFV